MERTQLFDLMGELKLYGTKAAFDEIVNLAHRTIPLWQRWISANWA